MVINKQTGCRTNEIKSELRSYLPKLKVETDISDGDVVFRTNQQPNDQFVQALRHLETMKRENRIKNYGVQNSTMDDVFLKITRDTNVAKESQSTSVDINTIGLFIVTFELCCLLRDLFRICIQFLRKYLDFRELSDVSEYYILLSPHSYRTEPRYIL